MDGNGNKVQALRQQFEVLQCDDNNIGHYLSTDSSNFGNIMGRHVDGIAGIMYAGNRSGYVDSVMPVKSRLYHQDVTPPSMMVPGMNAHQNYRNGIYVSSSITLHNDTPGDATYDTSYSGIQHPDDELLADDESQTEQSGSVNDSGSQSGAGMYGKVKRSNAFRKKDVVEPVEIRSKPRGKMNVERVKSLDNGSNGKPRKSFDNEINRASSVCVRPVNNNHVQQTLAEQQKAVNIVTPYQISDMLVADSRNRNTGMSGFNHAQNMTNPTQEFDYGIPAFRNESLSAKEHGLPPPIPPLPNFYQHYAQYQSSTDRPLSIIRDSQGNNQIAKTKSTSNLVIPPEKPPRTFLYDMFSDQALTQYQYQQRPLITKNAVVSKPQGNRQGFSPASFPPPTETYVIPAQTAHHHAYSTNPETPQKKVANYSAPGNSMIGSKVGSNTRATDLSNHQGLTRSKTESQIIVKNKNRSWEQTTDLELETHRHLLHGADPRAGYSYNFNGGHQGKVGNGGNVIVGPDYVDKNPQVHRRGVGNVTRFDGSRNFVVHNHSPSNLSPIPVIHQQHRHVHEPQYGKVISTSDYNVKSGLAVGSVGRNAAVSHLAETGMNVSKQDGMSMSTIVNSSGNRNKSSSSGKRVSSVNRCKSDDRLCEKSKSEWALNEVLNDKGNSGNMISNGRRNTVANAANSSSSHNIHHTGHASLESNTSSSASTKLFRSSIQQSIQNLMNQLFAPTGKDATSSTDSGIQLGSESLSSCDTPLGDSTTDTGDSDLENEAETSHNARQVVEARKGYIRQVSSFRKELGTSQNRLIPNSKKLHKSNEPLFECLLVVGLNRDAYTGSYHPYVKEMFPPNAKLASGVEQFCFPDSLEWPCHEGKSAQSYTLAITDHRGGRKYGCCFRILPEGANICIPITYCLISSNRAIGFYREVLREITRRHGCSEFLRRCWIEQLYGNSFPSPDTDIYIKEPVQEDTYVMSGKANTLQNINSSVFNNYASTKMVAIRRKADHRLDDKDLVTLLSKIDATTVLKIFGSILHERKVVLLSRALSTLSLCVEALESMLYPFTWQHTFIPILPLNMPDILDAPSPFLIGVLRSTQSTWEKHFDDGIVVDLDTNKIIRCVGDEGSILPKRIHRKLKDSLQYVMTMANQGDATKNVLFSECFIRMFVDVLGHYCHHIILQADGAKIFDRDTFIKSSESKATQNFLDWFSETSMFHFFIENRLKYNAKPGLFEQRIMGDQNSQNYGAPFKGKNMRSNRTFGINWLKDAFVMK